VLVSPHRLERPWQGQVEPDRRETRLAFDAGCYLCPGNTRANGERNPPYASTFTFDNDFPALLSERATPAEAASPLLVSESVRGRCRVVCFSPRHDLTLAEMNASGDPRGRVDAWAQRDRDAGPRSRLRYVQVFENKGAMMGCSNPHPHGQIWADECHTAGAGAQARDAARVVRAPRQRPRRRLPRGGAASRRARRLPQRELGGRSSRTGRCGRSS
jgi:UDPglucose--hexose-1-phosphate uridylyltransferase